jgi:hypothetical protein
MKATATKDGVTLKLSVEEAISLEAVLAGAVGPIARELPWYDAIADVLEAKHLPTTISHAVEQRFHHFHTSPTFWSEKDDTYVPNNSWPIRRPTS